MFRILLFGANGQLGWELQRTLAPMGQLIRVFGRDFDIANSVKTRELIRKTAPHLIVNAIAYNDVDGAEQNRETADVINHVVPGVMAEEAQRLGSLLVFYSTDYVFDGEKTQPYTELDSCVPINYYGYTKYQGENAIRNTCEFHFVFRTSWLYSHRRENFMMRILRWARENETLRVVDDQTGSPTWARMLAELTTLALMKALTLGPDWLAEHSGIYHLAGAGAATRFAWAQAILDLAPQRETLRCRHLLPAKTAEFPTPAQRPAYSVLDCRKFEQTFGLRIPPWQESLALAMDSGG